MSEMFNVDTAKIRSTARDVRKIADRIGDLASGDLKAMRNTVSQELRGEAAEALEETLADLKRDVEKLAGSLNTIQKALNKYAAKIEELDRELASKTNN